jgi:hypothetical protein
MTETNSHTPCFPVENQKDDVSAYKAVFEAKKAVSSIANKVFLKEGIIDSMTMPSSTIFFFWRPNNYRLKIPFKIGLDSTSKEVLPTIGLLPLQSRRGLRTIKVNSRITLQVGRSCVMAIFSLKNDVGSKQWYKVPGNNIKALESFIDGKVSEIEKSLRFEVSKLGLPLDYTKSFWLRHEDGVKNEEFIKHIPESLIIHDTFFKKVYGDELEFKSPIYLKNYISNRAIESVVPEIVNELEQIKLRLPEPINVPDKDAGWSVWRKYFYDNRERLGLDYRKVR